MTAREMVLLSSDYKPSSILGLKAMKTIDNLKPYFFLSYVFWRAIVASDGGCGGMLVAFYFLTFNGF